MLGTAPQTLVAPGATAPMLAQPWRVQRVRKETPDTVTIDLTPEDGTGMAFAPGQFNMLYMFGIGEIPISISGDPARPETLTHTVRAVGAVSRALCAVRPGDTIGVRGPYGAAWPVQAAEESDVVIVTGGIGLAPLRPAFYHLLTNRGHYGNVVLLYGARTHRDMLYKHELERWRSRYDLEVEVTVDSAVGGWNGHVGLVTTLIPRAPYDPQHTVVMICGPEIMMRFTIREFQKHGVADENIYISMERNMECGLGLCGHCQFGPYFVCKDGPVFRYADVKKWFETREL
jgi:NAD(P)H-flavin reductase